MYLDPGFGGMLLQLIVALAAGGGAMLFGFRRRITKLFKKDKTAPRKAKADGGVVDMMHTEGGLQSADYWENYYKGSSPPPPIRLILRNSRLHICNLRKNWWIWAAETGATARFSAVRALR